MTEAEFAPMPPAHVKGFRQAKPMTIGELHRWVASWNLFVERWNRAERSDVLYGHEPDWPDALRVAVLCRPGGFSFISRGDGRVGWIKQPRWRMYDLHGYRRPIKAAAVRWACWNGTSTLEWDA